MIAAMTSPQNSSSSSSTLITSQPPSPSHSPTSSPSPALVSPSTGGRSSWRRPAGHLPVSLPPAVPPQGHWPHPTRAKGPHSTDRPVTGAPWRLAGCGSATAGYPGSARHGSTAERAYAPGRRRAERGVDPARHRATPARPGSDGPSRPASLARPPTQSRQIGETTLGVCFEEGGRTGVESPAPPGTLDPARVGCPPEESSAWIVL